MDDELVGRKPRRAPPPESVPESAREPSPEPAPEPEPPRTPAPHGRRFKRHELELADGGRLVLGVDGSIDRLDPHGSRTQSWTPDDPDWPNHAIRFGLHPQAPTVTPQGRRVPGSRPPRW